MTSRVRVELEVWRVMIAVRRRAALSRSDALAPLFRTHQFVMEYMKGYYTPSVVSTCSFDP